MAAGVFMSSLAAWLTSLLATGTSLGLALRDAFAVVAVTGAASAVVLWTLVIILKPLSWLAGKVGYPVEFDKQPTTKASGTEAPARGVGRFEVGVGVFWGLPAGGGTGLMAGLLAGLLSASSPDPRPGRP